MARNTGKGYRKGAVNNRSQTKDPHGYPIKRNTENGQFIDKKSNKELFKGVTKEPDKRK